MTEPPPETDRREPQPATDVGITYAFDDEADPRYVTLYPADHESLTTAWLTIDVEHAVDLYAMA